MDSGSSVAVLTYLTYILETLNHDGLIRLILHYMLGTPAQPPQDSKPSRPSTLAQRRKSETLISNNAIRVDDPSPDLITLTNILHGYLGSQNHQTITASLRLLATILESWHEFANTRLLKVQISRANRKRSKSIHDQQLEILYSLAEAILDHDALEESYESHLQDAQMMLEMHPCSADQLLPLNIEALEKMVLRAPPEQRIVLPDDTLLTCLLSLLDQFLVNDIAVNLSLSETLAALASCRETRLEGWLLGSALEVSVDTETKAEKHSRDIPSSISRPEVASPVFSRLASLVERIDRLRQDIQDFDIYLAERRHVFKVGGEIDDALADVAVQRSHESQDRKLSSQRDLTAVGSISERLHPSGDNSRSISPRGRQQDLTDNNRRVPKSLVGRLSHLRMSPSPSRSNPLERPYSPSPLRRRSMSSTASSPIPSPRGPPDVLHQKLRFKVTAAGHRRQPRESGGSETSSLHSESVKGESDLDVEEKEISLSHLLTNVIILQEFILELAAIIQVRASLFGEVSLT